MDVLKINQVLIRKKKLRTDRPVDTHLIQTEFVCVCVYEQTCIDTYECENVHFNQPKRTDGVKINPSGK